MGMMKKQLERDTQLRADLEACEAMYEAFRKYPKYKTTEDVANENLREAYSKSMDEIYSGGTWNDRYLKGSGWDAF